MCRSSLGATRLRFAAWRLAGDGLALTGALVVVGGGWALRAGLGFRCSVSCRGRRRTLGRQVAKQKQPLPETSTCGWVLSSSTLPTRVHPAMAGGCRAWVRVTQKFSLCKSKNTFCLPDEYFWHCAFSILPTTAAPQKHTPTLVVSLAFFLIMYWNRGSRCGRPDQM